MPIFIHCIPPPVKRIFRLQAFKQGIIGEGYVWIFYTWYSKEWYLAEDSSLSCTRAEMKEAVEGSFYISTHAQDLSPSQEPTISGLVSRMLTYIEYTGMCSSD